MRWHFSPFVLLEVKPELFSNLFNIKPDFKELARFPNTGYIICCTDLDLTNLSNRELDFTTLVNQPPAENKRPVEIFSRMFAPALGIAEDPVTGAAHSLLFPYFAKRLEDQSAAVALQCSKRGGILVGDLISKPGRVLIMAEAVIFHRGILLG